MPNLFWAFGHCYQCFDPRSNIFDFFNYNLRRETPFPLGFFELFTEDIAIYLSKKSTYFKIPPVTLEDHQVGFHLYYYAKEKSIKITIKNLLKKNEKLFFSHSKDLALSYKLWKGYENNTLRKYEMTYQKNN